MSLEDEYRRKAEALLSLAAGADNMKERGRLIDEAMRWHSLALDLHESAHDRANDNDGEADESEATA